MLKNDHGGGTAIPAVSTFLGFRRCAAPLTLVLGLGNFILRDDGVGVHALRQFRRVAPQSCLAVEAGTAVLSAFSLIEQARRIIAFDAMMAGGSPGTVYSIRGEEVLQEGLGESLHELGFTWVLRSLNEPRPEVVVIAAEPAIIDYGMDLSPALQAAVPRMVEGAISILSGWEAGLPTSALC